MCHLMGYQDQEKIDEEKLKERNKAIDDLNNNSDRKKRILDLIEKWKQEDAREAGQRFRGLDKEEEC